MRRRKRSSGLLLTLAIIVIIAGGILYVGPMFIRPSRPHHLARAVNNAKQVKLALDSFAMDNDGLYPCAETEAFYECPTDGTSNALFRQLFASANTNSERIFWLRGAEICSGSPPDDTTAVKGRFAVAQTLQPGDNAWSYYEGLENVAHPDSPIVLGPILPDHSGYQWDLFDGKIVVVRVDSSARPIRVRPDGRILDDDGRDILTEIDPGPEYEPILRHPANKK